MPKKKFRGNRKDHLLLVFISLYVTRLAVLLAPRVIVLARCVHASVFPKLLVPRDRSRMDAQFLGDALVGPVEMFKEESYRQVFLASAFFSRRDARPRDLRCRHGTRVEGGDDRWRRPIAIEAQPGRRDARLRH